MLPGIPCDFFASTAAAQSSWMTVDSFPAHLKDLELL